MRHDSAWQELLYAIGQLAAADPRDRTKGNTLATWFKRHHQATGCGCVVRDPRQAVNRVAEQLRTLPDHVVFIYNRNDTRRVVERYLLIAWPATLRTAMLVNAPGATILPIRLIYRDDVTAFVAQHAPSVELKHLPGD